MTTYDIIKGIAKEKNLSISAVERESGLGNGVIVGWREGNPRSDLLYKVAKTLGVSMEELIKPE